MKFLLGFLLGLFAGISREWWWSWIVKAMGRNWVRK